MSSTPPQGPHYQPPSYPYQQPQTQYAPQGFGAYQQPQHPQGSGGGGSRGVLAAVLGSLLAIAVLAVAAIVVTSGGDDGNGGEPGGSGDTEDVAGPGTSERAGGSEDAGSDDPDGQEVVAQAERIGTRVGSAELLVGDCIDYDRGGGTVEEYEIVACDQAHAAEVGGQVEHPSAGGGYPQVDELDRYAYEQCPSLTEQYVGADTYDTTLRWSSLVPTFAEWSAGHEVVNCTIELVDGSALTRPVSGSASELARPGEVVVTRLKVGDCFDPADAVISAFDLYAGDLVSLTDCGSAHQGFFFGRGLLRFGAGEVYPSADEVSDAAIEVCDEQFAGYFGVDPFGFDYRFWSPIERTWATGDRTVHCAIIDDRGLPATLDYQDYVAVADAGTGTCFVLPPARVADDLGLFDRVQPVDCGTEFHGQLFGAGELDTGSYPGADAAANQTTADCDEHYADFAVSGTLTDYVYWSPTEAAWADGNRRYGCAFLSDTPYTGSFEG